MTLRFAKLDPAARAPERGSAGAAGLDVRALLAGTVPARGRLLVRTGLGVVAPPDHYVRVAARSGLAVRHGISVGAGVVDEDYRGELGVLLFNHSDEDFAVNAGDRVAQLVVERISTAAPEEVSVERFSTWTTERGEGGFGSTGRA